MATNDFTPKYGKKAFQCPHCKAVTQQDQPKLEYTIQDEIYVLQDGNDMIGFSKCLICLKISLWASRAKHKPDTSGNFIEISTKSWQMIYPLISPAESPNQDMPDNIRNLYEEAANVLPISPKSSAALLRLALQHLMNYLEVNGKDINDNIAILVEKGLSEKVAKSMDILRVFGNESVHPGTIRLDDSIDDAVALFNLLNIIIEQMISQDLKINVMYQKIPEEKREAIEYRESAEKRKKKKAKKK